MQKQKAGRTVQEVQNAGAIRSNGQKGIKDRQHQKEHSGTLCKCQNREKKAYADDGDVLGRICIFDWVLYA